jgi:hypothetical protein
MVLSNTIPYEKNGNRPEAIITAGKNINTEELCEKIG